MFRITAVKDGKLESFEFSSHAQASRSYFMLQRMGYRQLTFGRVPL